MARPRKNPDLLVAPSARYWIVESTGNGMFRRIGECATQREAESWAAGYKEGAKVDPNTLTVIQAFGTPE